ncbi:MAG: phosphatidylserine decarboxylase [Gammaproteobacteria bacterium]|nr:phosphatidylserine decarboxylase [Gammaproteobacteria bacterium]
MEKLKTAYQYILPQHGLTRLVGKLAASKNKLIKRSFINFFLKQFDINMAEAANEDPESYATFNDFFTRALKTDARPLAGDEETIVSPVDGVVSQSGKIINGDIFQAKGHRFTLSELIGNETEFNDRYQDGEFATLYLSPKDYHRIHMPVNAELKTMTYIPGRLFSVNPATARTIPRLFARNERVVVHFETQNGPMAMVLVGATIVGSIETIWSGVVTPPTGPVVKTWHYTKSQHIFKKGDEMGRFLLGSTVVLLFGKDQISWSDSCSADSPLRMGEVIA